MNREPRRAPLVANAAMKKAAADKPQPAPKQKKIPNTALKSGTRVGQVYWCDFPHTNLLPEFDADHLAVVIKSGKLDDVTLVVPLTKQDQSANPHGYPLKNNPNQQSANESWAVCDHIYAVSAARLRPLRNARNEARTPFALDDEDIKEISKRVFKVLTPFLQKGVETAKPTSEQSPD